MKGIIKPIFFLVLLGLFSCAKSPSKSLHETVLNSNWTFKEVNSEKWLPATVPGCVHTDLINNEIIEDPFYRLNESKVQWVDKKDWIYRTNFFLNEGQSNKKNHEICFQGLDTYCQVFLNDTQILKSNNMHRTYFMDISKHLKKGKNQLTVLLESPIKNGLELYNALDYIIPVSANDQAETGEIPDGKRISAHTRKAGYHYGWDWGPRLVTSGIWRPITISSWDTFRITNLKTSYSLDSVAHIKVYSTIESSVETKSAKIIIKLNGKEVFKSDQNKISKGKQELVNSFKIKNPKLWWPNGMGEQNLYDLETIVEINNKIDAKHQKIGIRKIEFKGDTNFHFKVNGHFTFIKGVNYIPQDIFLNKVKNKHYEKTLLSAANANMNMIRVWGGGVYEDERFYDLCDSLGLLVWQDFMFACSMYPGDDDFLENVRIEAEDNFNRISKHTSVALWCGNNENLSAWKRWGWEQTVIKDQSKLIAEKIWKAYDTLFHHILPKVVNVSMANKINHPTHNYWSSSPSASQGIAESYSSGDTHYWGVWWGKEPFENFNFKISAFMSEYGFQSFPEYNSFKKFASENDEDMYSDVMKHHQRSSIGNATIEEYLKREYNPPKDFPSLLHTSQVLQADGIRTGIEAHRRNKKRCTGTLYWQLNDCWPGASWSSIDYYGKWKALHYNVKRAFKPVIISHEFVDSSLKVFVISDLLKEFFGEVEVILSTFDGNKQIKKWRNTISLKPNGVENSLTISKENLPNSIEKKEMYLTILLKQKDKIISSKNIFFFPFKDLNSLNPELAYKACLDTISNQISINISSKNFAKGVYLSSATNKNFSDNYFDLIPGGEKTIYLTIEENQRPEQIINSIKLRSLWDNFN